MNDAETGKPVRDPQDIAPELVIWVKAGDAPAMAALYERDAVRDCGKGRLAVGKEAIRAFYTRLVEIGAKFELRDQQAAPISVDLALTSTRLPSGGVTVELACRQNDGTWLWVIDQPSFV